MNKRKVLTRSGTAQRLRMYRKYRAQGYGVRESALLVGYSAAAAGWLEQKRRQAVLADQEAREQAYRDWHPGAPKRQKRKPVTPTKREAVEPVPVRDTGHQYGRKTGILPDPLHNPNRPHHIADWDPLA